MQRQSNSLGCSSLLLKEKRFSDADTVYDVLDMSGLHSVYLKIRTKRNAKMRTASSDGLSVLKGRLNGAIYNPFLQLTQILTELILTNVNSALPAESCVALWLRLVLETYLYSFIRAPNSTSTT